MYRTPYFTYDHKDPLHSEKAPVQIDKMCKQFVKHGYSQVFTRAIV